MADAVQIARVASVVLLLAAAALAATPRGRMPLALRGLWRVMSRDGVAAGGEQSGESVGVARRVLAFVLVMAAVGVALA